VLRSVATLLTLTESLVMAESGGDSTNR
jgi:hypothetical protein